jgi:hypothetical protein
MRGYRRAETRTIPGMESDLRLRATARDDEASRPARLRSRRRETTDDPLKIGLPVGHHPAPLIRFQIFAQVDPR